MKQIKEHINFTVHNRTSHLADKNVYNLFDYYTLIKISPLTLNDLKFLIRDNIFNQVNYRI